MTNVNVSDPGKAAKRNPFWTRLFLGILILLMIAAFLYGLGWAILSPLSAWEKSLDATLVKQVNEAMIMFFAGGLGSGVYTIRAFLLHACEKKDLDPAFFPWYPFRFILGSLMGLIIYLTLRGGLLFLTINGQQSAITDLNYWSLAAIGALVGLFSKYALEKLRQVFRTVFGDTSEESKKIDAVVNALPEDSRKKVDAALKNEPGL